MRLMQLSKPKEKTKTQNLLCMKKNSIDFESRFWSGRSKLSPVALGDVFFQFHDLATAKERLNLMMQYAVQGKPFGGLSLPPVAAVADPGRVVPPEEIREMDRGGRSGDRQSVAVRFAFGGRIPRSGPGVPQSLYGVPNGGTGGLPFGPRVFLPWDFP